MVKDLALPIKIEYQRLPGVPVAKWPIFEVIDNNDLIWPCILGEDSIFEISKLDFSKFKGYFEIKFRKDLN